MGSPDNKTGCIFLVVTIIWLKFLQLSIFLVYLS